MRDNFSWIIWNWAIYLPNYFLWRQYYKAASNAPAAIPAAIQATPNLDYSSAAFVPDAKFLDFVSLFFSGINTFYSIISAF
jgi:hypothetical protein